MTPPRWLFWHRRDLRLADNLGLAAAAAATPAVTGVVVLDPAELAAMHQAPARRWFLVGLLGSAFPLSFSKTQALLDQLLGVEISLGDRHDPPALERSTGAAHAGGPCFCPSATGGLRG